MTDSADVVTDSPATRSPAVSHHKPESWEHGPYMPEDDDDYYDPTPLPPTPVPPRLKSIETLYNEFKARVRLGVREEFMKDIFADLISDTQLNLISTLKPYFKQNEDHQDVFVTTVGNNSIKFTDGDFIWAASNINRFISFILAIGHEHIHGLQNTKLHLETHDEKEIMAHFFTLFPNEAIEWITKNYMGYSTGTINFTFPRLTTLKEIRQYSNKSFEYYNNVPEPTRSQYKWFADKVINLSIPAFLFTPSFPPPFVPDISE